MGSRFIVTTIALCAVSCSVVYVRPYKPYKEYTKHTCTSNTVAPWFDIGLASASTVTAAMYGKALREDGATNKEKWITLSASMLAVAFVSSAYYGYMSTRTCDYVKEELH